MGRNLKRGLVFFHYFESDIFYRENLIFFLSVAYREDLDFVVIISGECSVNLPEFFNVVYIFTENKNNDFGGYVIALDSCRNRMDDYDFFIFVNSSVRGPFVANERGMSWVESFTRNFNENVALVGSSIAILERDSLISQHLRRFYSFAPPYSHVQTTAYALTSGAMKHLIKTGFYDFHERLDKLDVICRYEIGLSQEIIKAGWDMKACLSKYNDIDYRSAHSDINPTSRQGDALYRRAYFGKTAAHRELVFVKTNRRIISPIKLIFVTFLELLRVTNSSVRNWGEYRKLRSDYMLKILLLPLSEVKKAVDRILK